MKLLFDQNLSFKLVGLLATDFPGSLHVRDCGLDHATDAEVWEYARDHDFVIVTKDTDFHQRCFLFGAPPKVVWLRLGNCTTQAVERAVRSRSAEITAFIADDSEALLILG